MDKLIIATSPTEYLLMQLHEIEGGSLEELKTDIYMEVERSPYSYDDAIKARLYRALGYEAYPGTMAYDLQEISKSARVLGIELVEEIMCLLRIPKRFIKCRRSENVKDG